MEMNQVHSVHFLEDGGKDKTQTSLWHPHLEAWHPSRRSAVLGDRAQGSGSREAVWELTHIIGKGTLEPVEDKPTLLP